MLSRYGLTGERGPLDIDGDKISFAPHRPVIGVSEEWLLVGVLCGTAFEVVTSSRPSGRFGLTKPRNAARIVAIGDRPRAGYERCCRGGKSSHRCCRITDRRLSCAKGR